MTDHIALYRKYRPATFDDVVGQDHVVETLKKAIANDSVAHAYLFSGGRGIGKTSVARLLAKALGTSDKDLYEMDAASNRKIDDFRELNDSVHTLPFDSRYKVYIIDEVHMLTKEAFNAFLKTLEEPPKHVIFILATTEVEKLPDTIVSRCQTFSFHTPTRTVLAEALVAIAKKEKVSLDEGGAELIAVLADGSFRDALGVLQKVLAFSSNSKITRTEVEEVTGAPRSEIVLALVEALAAGNAEEAVGAVADALSESADMLTFQKLLLERVRAVLLLKIAPKHAAHIREQFGNEDAKRLEAIASAPECAINSKVLLALLEAYKQTPHAYIAQLPLELAIAETLTN